MLKILTKSLSLMLVVVMLAGCTVKQPEVKTNTDSVDETIVTTPFNLDMSSDAYFLMGMSHELVKVMIKEDQIEIYEHDNMERMCDDWYQLKNGIGIQVNRGFVIGCGTFYNSEEHTATMLGVDNTYDRKAIKELLGEPFNEDDDLVYCIRYDTYIKFFLDKKTDKVMYITCFNSATV